MKYALYDFQKTAVSSLLTKMSSMRRSYDEDGSLSAVALTAPTGAGKTVISAAVIEGLFYGNDVYAGDDRAVVLWLTDSPSLNEQTLKRFDAATDLLNKTVMVTINNGFAKTHSKMMPGHVYFLNRQLLGSGRRLEGEAEGGRSFYDVLNNTIEDPDIHLFLFIDEAHRGLGDNGTSDRTNRTIYANIIDGRVGINKPMPCVVGISATPERFNFAMANRVNRDIKSAVVISVDSVRASGLIKDTIELRTPKESANTKHQDLTQACIKLASSSKLWSDYCDKNGIPKVVPLMVVQVEDKVSKETLGALCQQIRKTLPWLDISECFANVFGEHEDIITDFGSIPYVSPENINEQTEIKVLFAKDAVSTGWDCPRAEVIYSRRKRTDSTYIAQLIGRMIRTPLTRRIESLEELNTVACYLPEYDAQTVENVVERLKEDNVAAEGGAEVIINATDVRFYGETKTKAEKQIQTIEKNASGKHNNDNASTSAKNDTADSYTVVLDSDDVDLSIADGASTATLKAVIERVPKADSELIKTCFEEIITRQVRHDKNDVFLDLWDCIDVITADIDNEAGLDETIKDEFYNNVEGEIAKHPAEFKRDLNNIRNTTVTIKRLDPLTGDIYEDREELVTNDSDRMTVYYKNAVNKFAGASDIIKYYINKRISDVGEDNAMAVSRIAAVGYCIEIVSALELWAENKVSKLLDEYAPQRYAVSEEHSAIWDRIEGNTKPFIERNLCISTTQTRQNTEYDKYAKHIICDEYGWAYLKLNEIEQKVVKTEIARPINVAWYRNQSKNLNGSLAIPYEINGEYENMYPDFIFFQQLPDKRIIRTIVDPHGDWLGDSVAKLKGYVAYLKDHPKMFGAVQVVADEKNGEYRYLDLMKPETQKAIEEFSGSSAKDLFNGKHSKVYTIKND